VWGCKHIHSSTLTTGGVGQLTIFRGFSGLQASQQLVLCGSCWGTKLIRCGGVVMLLCFVVAWHAASLVRLHCFGGFGRRGLGMWLWGHMRHMGSYKVHKTRLQETFCCIHLRQSSSALGGSEVEVTFSCGNRARIERSLYTELGGRG
jgi:hypothetical protein